MSTANPDKEEPRKKRGRPSSRDSGDGTTFLGMKLPRDLYQRLYRIKARLEFGSGEFYGMGRVVERVMRKGIDQVEKEVAKSATSSPEEI